MKRFSFIILLTTLSFNINGQSPSFNTFMNPVIPGDHPDCTLTKIGNYFYTTGSSFSPTPKIYRSTDLVHWEAISQPVSNAWSLYGSNPSDGIWGGHVVFYNNKYWHFFGGPSYTMYFVTADNVEGPWSSPSKMICPTSVPGLGRDNSIFIDDDGSWYLLVKNGQENNWILQLGDDGQPKGAIYDLRWINPSPNFPYSWAEGPVMWKYKGYYYYSFARHAYGGQVVMRSQTLTSEKSSWEILGDLFASASVNLYSQVEIIAHPQLCLTTVLHGFFITHIQQTNGRAADGGFARPIKIRRKRKTNSGLSEQSAQNSTQTSKQRYTMDGA
jgi:hypothetical protein